MSSKQIQEQQQRQIEQLAYLIAQKRNQKRNLRTNQINQVRVNNSTNNLNKKINNHNGYHYHEYGQSGYSAKNGERQKGKQSKQLQKEDVQSLDVSDLLKTLSHQKKVLNPWKRQQMYDIHYTQNLTQDDYKHFMMIISQSNYRKLQYPGYYQQILKQIPKYPQSFFTCIKKDIPRTMPDQHPLQQSLRNVLYAYAIRNPSLLYCQGMNYLVGFILINKFSDEQTFWLLVELIEDIVMPTYFKDLSEISVTVQVFEDVMSEVFPELAYQMQQVGMESSIFLVGWYVCLFTKGFINSVSQFLLQQIVLQSYSYPIGFTLIRISLGIFATLFTRQQRFEYQEKDFKSLKQSIQSNVYEISLDQLRTGLNYFSFDYEAYERLTGIYRRRKQKIFTKALQKQLNQKKISLPICNIDHPVCIQRVEIQKKIGTIQQVLILKNNIPIQSQYIENYFVYKINKAQPKISYESSQQCPITHHSHICHLSSTHSKIMPHKKLTEQSQKYFPTNQGQCSIQIQSRFSKIQDRFSQLSSFFVIQQDRYKSQLEQYRDSSEEQKQNINGHEKEDKDKLNGNKGYNNFNIVASVGNVFKKAFDSIKLLRSQLAEGNFLDVMVQNSP